MATKIKPIIKEYLFDMKYSNKITQMFNFFIILFLITITKIFLILQNTGDVFITSFETCVWVFMVVWLMLRIFHSFNILCGYWQLSSIPLILYLIFPNNNSWLISLSVIMIAIFNLFELKQLFAKECKKE